MNNKTELINHIKLTFPQWDETDREGSLLLFISLALSRIEAAEARIAHTEFYINSLGGFQYGIERSESQQFEYDQMFDSIKKHESAIRAMEGK